MRVRYAAAPLAAVGCSVMFLGSTMFVTWFVDDPFLVRAQPVVFESLAGAPLPERTVPFNVARMVLSPRGRYVALSSPDRTAQSVIVHAGPSAGPLTAFDGSDARFVDESRLLLLERQRTSTVLRLVDLEHQNREVWSRPVRVWSGRLSFSPVSRRWQILGWNESGEFAAVSGRIGEDTVSEQQWTSPDADNDEIEPLAVSHGRLVAVENRFMAGRTATGILRLWAAAMTPSMPMMESQLWLIGPKGRTPFTTSRLPSDCRELSLDEPITCASFDGTKTSFFSIDPSTGQPTAQGFVDGRFYFHDDGGGGWLTGWLDRAPVLIRPSTREGLRIPRRDGRRAEHIAAASEQMVATVSPDVHRSTIRFYARASTR